MQIVLTPEVPFDGKLRLLLDDSWLLEERIVEMKTQRLLVDLADRNETCNEGQLRLGYWWNFSSNDVTDCQELK